MKAAFISAAILLPLSFALPTNDKTFTVSVDRQNVRAFRHADGSVNFAALNRHLEFTRTKANGRKDGKKSSHKLKGNLPAKKVTSTITVTKTLAPTTKLATFYSVTTNYITTFTTAFTTITLNQKRGLAELVNKIDAAPQTVFKTKTVTVRPTITSSIVKVKTTTAKITATTTATTTVYNSPPQNGVKYVALNDEWGSFYTSNISVGGQSFRVLIDTGSSDLWVPSVSCKTKQCSNWNKYDPSKSSSSQLQQGETFSVLYGDNSHMSGLVYEDTVTGVFVADLTGGAEWHQVGGIAVQNQIFAACNKIAWSDPVRPYDGIMGVSYVNSSDGLPGSNYFVNLWNTNTMAKQWMSLSLTAPEAGFTSSEMTLGGADPGRYQGDIEFTETTYADGRFILSTNATVNGQVVVNDNIDATIDSGTSAIIMDLPSAQALWKAVPGASQYGGSDSPYFVFPCAQPPTIGFIFNEQTWTVRTDQISLGPLSAGSSQCIGAVLGLDDFDGWILGDPLFISQFIVFDFENFAIGFAAPR